MTEPSGTSNDLTGSSLVEHFGSRMEGMVDDLLLDRIDALRVLRADSREQKDDILEQIAGRGQPEQDIVKEISKVRPL